MTKENNIEKPEDKPDEPEASRRMKYSLPEGVMPNVETVDPVPPDETRKKLGGNKIKIRGSGISTSAGGARGTRKRSTQAWRDE